MQCMLREPDVRVTKSMGSKPYDQVRVSIVSCAGSEPRPPSNLSYSARFRYRWLQYHLESDEVVVRPGQSTPIDLGTGRPRLDVSLPRQGDGVAGLLIADPCIRSATGGSWIPCSFGVVHRTRETIPRMVNAFAAPLGGSRRAGVSQPAAPAGLDFWGILGDNFYDRLGGITGDFFGRVSSGAKSKLFMAVPGNHDYWVYGSPLDSEPSDQCGNGHMQYYAMDTMASQGTSPGRSQGLFDFSADPDAKADSDAVKAFPGHLGGEVDGREGSSAAGCALPAAANALWYNQIGNVGFVGQSGAYSLAETMPLMREACAWLARQPGVEVAVLLGHWDQSEYGAKPGMSMPEWYEEMAKLPGCDIFAAANMLKFVVGHTHCNNPHPRGAGNSSNTVGFRVAGFGMLGCGDFGAPVLDTTGGRIRYLYFDMSRPLLRRRVLRCAEGRGWRSCLGYATTWLDEPIRPVGQAARPREQENGATVVNV